VSASKAPARSMLILAFLAIYFIWGSTYLAIRYAVETMPPFLMAGVRFLFAGAVMYAIVRMRNPEKPTFVQWRSTTIIGAFLLLGGNGAVVWAEQHLTSSMTVLLVTTVSLWMVLMNWARRDGVRPGVLEVLGITLGIGGVAILVGGSSFSGADGVHLGGVVALLFGAFSWAAGSIYSRQAPLPKSAFLATAMEMLTGGALLTIAGLIFGEGSRVDFSSFSTASVLSFVYLIVFGSFIGFTAYVWLLGVTTPAKVSTYAFVNPVIAVVLGCTVGGETFSSRMLVAMVVIIGGVVLITLHRMKAATPPEVEECGLDVGCDCEPVAAVEEVRLVHE
jgi:drug/metabolite transporter (DMT)-like permease